ncbi:MAG: polyprenyl synthetase family protein [Bacteroidetes bacterium]|nr:polyprenyl synthetase family protein [Bacteroidota bacterium]
MQALTHYAQLVEQGLHQVVDKDTPANLYEPMRYLLKLSAKRLRPALLLMACEQCGGTATHALPAAYAIELFHNFTLMHDDIMDNAPLRRGKETVHEKWNKNIAILSGDALYTLAMEQLCTIPTNTSKLLKLFTTTAIEVCEGQQLDMDYEQAAGLSIPDYVNMIRLKTAVLVGASLKMGAIVANAEENVCNTLYDFGMQIGIAFQLQDDLLDAYGDENFGKQLGGDILANKKTFLLLKALECANIDQYDLIADLLANKKEKYNTYEKVKKMLAIYNDLQIKEQTLTEVEKYKQAALQALENANFSFTQKLAFIDFAELLMKRKI